MLYQVHVFSERLGFLSALRVELRATLPDINEYDTQSDLREFIAVPLPTAAIKAGRWQERITNLTEIPWRSELEP